MPKRPGRSWTGVPADLNAPSLAAILKDAGSRLELGKQLMDVYVVDRVEKPPAINVRFEKAPDAKVARYDFCDLPVKAI